MTVFKWAENSLPKTWTMLLLLLEVRVNTGAGRPQQVLLLLIDCYHWFPFSTHQLMIVQGGVHGCLSSWGTIGVCVCVCKQ